MGKRDLLKDALRTIKALEDINVAYRIGGRPKESSLDWLSDHKDRVIAELEAGEKGREPLPKTVGGASRLGEPEDKGEVSDGYHTFNELYEHRHALFAVACHFLGGWKSKLHHDGTMFPGWFIAGLTTCDGPATYHLPLRLWDAFPGREREHAPEWDGHTPGDVVTRLWAHVAAMLPHAPEARSARESSSGPLIPGHSDTCIIHNAPYCNCKPPAGEGSREGGRDAG